MGNAIYGQVYGGQACEKRLCGRTESPCCAHQCILRCAGHEFHMCFSELRSCIAVYNESQAG